MGARRVINLTHRQARLLREIQEAGQRRYNGRAYRSLAVLRDAGLVELDQEWVGSWRSGKWRLTARSIPLECRCATGCGGWVCRIKLVGRRL